MYNEHKYIKKLLQLGESFLVLVNATIIVFISLHKTRMFHKKKRNHGTETKFELLL